MTRHRQDLLQFTKKGIYCPKADVYIDPWKPVARALVTHGHSDHARPGSKHYLCTPLSKPILLHRLGHQHFIETVDYGEIVSVNGVQFSFHPAGHIIGSAQVRVERNGEVWVVSGDYKTDEDPVSGEFEVVPCNTFITESTFGLPVYRWPDQSIVIEEINTWWKNNAENGRTSVISAYSLGKAQRVIQSVDHTIGPVFCHGAVQTMNDIIRVMGVGLAQTRYLDDDIPWETLRSALVVAPSSALSSPWMKRFKDCATAAASGWMALRGTRRWQSVDRGFVLSDHADWEGLNDAIEATGAKRVIVTHGYTDIFARWLREQGYEASTEKTMYEGEEAVE